MWWRETIDANFPDIEQNHKEGLLLRWAYGDKKTLNLRSLDKELGKDKASLIKKFDKEDVKKKYKENIRPFEDLFLELGSIILKNASNFVAASPDQEMQRLHNQIRTEAAKIKKSGGIDQIKKVMDPEIPVNLYDLGLIYNINIDSNNNVLVNMTLTNPNCPVAGEMPV